MAQSLAEPRVVHEVDIRGSSTVSIVSSLSSDAFRLQGVSTAGLNGALDMVNRRVAGAMAKQPKRVVVEFYHMPEIAQQSWSKPNGRRVMACTISEAPEPVPIAILMHSGWRKSYIHELCHVYSPDSSERKIQELTKVVIKHLRSLQGSLL